MREGGMWCTLMRQKRGDRKIDGVLSFSQSVTAEIKTRAFRSVKIEPVYVPSKYPFSLLRLKAIWSQQRGNRRERWQAVWFEKKSGAKVWIAKSWGVSPETLESILSLPYSLRRGRVSWFNFREMSLIFWFQEDLPSPSLGQKEKLLGRCSLRFKKDPGIYLLAFLTEAAQKMKNFRGLSFCQIASNSLLFRVEEKCLLPCDSCSRLDCFPLRLTKRGKPELHICLTNLPVFKENKKETTRSFSIKGEVWRRKGGLISVEFPDLQKGR